MLASLLWTIMQVCSRSVNRSADAHEAITVPRRSDKISTDHLSTSRTDGATKRSIAAAFFDVVKRTS